MVLLGLSSRRKGHNPTSCMYLVCILCVSCVYIVCLRTRKIQAKYTNKIAIIYFCPGWTISRLLFVGLVIAHFLVYQLLIRVNRLPNGGIRYEMRFGNEKGSSPWRGTAFFLKILVLFLNHRRTVKCPFADSLAFGIECVC